MASPNEKLANSLVVLRRLTKDGRKIIGVADIGRTDRERLTKSGYLAPITAGWLLLSSPNDGPGETTAWNASFWEFVARYLNERFDSDWAIGPHNSIPLLADNMTIPSQVLIHAPNANNQCLPLPANRSIFAYRASIDGVSIIEKNGVRVFTLGEALAHASPATWAEHRNEIIALLGSTTSPDDLLVTLLDKGRVKAAGRLAGAFRALGRDEFAERITKTMKRVDYDLRVDDDPFAGPVPISLRDIRPSPPVMTRVRLMWAQMRDDVIQCFSNTVTSNRDDEAFLKDVDDAYVSDAYHSLSIEGYQVSEELIERVRKGDFDPESSLSDKDQRNAMAAKGYWQTFQAVRDVIKRMFAGEDPADLIEREHQNWFQTMFEPSVRAGIIRPSSLIGYRRHPVYLRGSMHVPPQHDVIPDAMAAFFECLRDEEQPAVRAVLGHLLFTFIHPFPDGNGRTGRFIMNAMLASGRYPWTVVPVERRSEYMATLEAASVQGDIKPFAHFIAGIIGRKHRPQVPGLNTPSSRMPSAKNLQADRDEHVTNETVDHDSEEECSSDSTPSRKP